MATLKIRIKDQSNNLIHPETVADIVLRGNSNVAADLTAVENTVGSITVVNNGTASNNTTYKLSKDSAQAGATITVPDLKYDVVD